MSFKKVHFKWPLEEASNEAAAAFSGLAFPPGASSPPHSASARRSNSLSPKKIIRLPDEKKRLSENFSYTSSRNNGNNGNNNTQDINYFPNAYCDDEISQLFEKSEKSGEAEIKAPKASKTVPVTYRYRIKQYESLPQDESIRSSPPKSLISEIQKPQKIERKIPRPLNNPVIIRPRTLKNKRSIDFEKLKSPDIDISPGIESIPFFSENSVSCYGTPKAERKKKPRSAKKSATEPIVYETTMTDRNGSLSARQSIPGGVEYNQISRRIIALTYPTNGSDSGYRHSIKEISEKLRRNYADKYKIFNVSQKRSDLGRANTGSVVELGWPDQLAPPLDRLCSICKQIENWLNTSPENLVVIHCKGWRSRAAIVIAAYMHYTNICAGDESVEDRFGMKIFSEKFLGVDGQPSHKRYVRYFANLLSGTTKVNPAPIFLTNISLKKINGKGIVLKIYERMKPVYSSQPISIKSSAEIEIDNGLSLRGDVLVKCFEKRSGSERSLVFQCQFNTCALDLETQHPILHFYREELDLITSDRSLDNQAAIEFSFVFEPPKEKKSVKSSKRSLSLSSSIGGGRSAADQREGEFSRADSYENFDRPEDDRSISTSLIESPHPRPPSVSEGTTSALYTELQKTTGTTSSTSQQPSPLDGADSGIGSDSPKQTMAPPVPPKPRRPSSSMDLDPDDPMRSAYEDSTIGRDRSVLPASVRPSSRTSNHQNQNQNQNQQQRASSPAESTATGRSATPRIEPDLVAKDRYDPSSKCFSYVPAKALKEHYTAPKKPPTSRRQSMERSDLDIPTMDKESLRNISITPTTELTRRAETPKWDAVVDKIAPKIDLPDVRKDFRQLEKERYNGGGDYFSKTLPNGYTGKGSGSNYGRDEDEFEKPVIVDQAKKAPPPRRRGRYGSYSTTNDEYNSDMDDLMDPEFYLSYSAAPTPPPDRYGPGSKSVELPRKQMKTISQRDLDEIDSIIESTVTLPPARSCYTPKPEPPRPSAERDAFRLRNCRSVNSGPTTRKLFSNERYDSITDAENPDDWLKNKLRTLHSKRGGYPDAMQRKNTEKKLLEELKNANPNNQLQKGEYISEGIGQSQKSQTQNGNKMNDSQIDLLEEYQKEEERLRNTRSPFTAIDDFRSMNRAQTGTPNSMIGNNSSSRYGRGTTPTSQIIRSKPPTPPPRERSKSPTIRSPQPFRKSATPSAYQQERNRIASTEYLSDDDDDTTEFSHLHSLVNESSNMNGGNKRAQTAEPSNYYSSSNGGTGTKSILKRGNNRQSQNDTPISYADSLMDDRSEKKDIYASPVPSSRRFGGSSTATRISSFGEDSLPRGASSYASIDSPRVGGGASASSTPLPFSPGRSETPAFPVSNRETPLPFHPLLYQGAAGGGDNSHQQQQTSGFNSLVHRSNSPRSMYYGQSRRSSMTSVGWFLTFFKINYLYGLKNC